MILQSLNQYYRDLLSAGKIESPGWSPAKISYALYINQQGELEQVACLKEQDEKSKKTKLIPRVMSLPEAVKRSSGIAANFLWDNATYILGDDAKGKPERSLKCFQACAQLHRELLQDINSDCARAVLAFFEHWKPEETRSHPALQEYLDDILSNANLVFRYRSQFVHEDEAVREAWNKHTMRESDGEKMVCVVTGEKTVPAVLHPSIKGIMGAQSSGASLVSFNAPSFCSYGHEQGLNAPTSQTAAFAYGAALNYLIADREHVRRIGDTTVLCWAEGGQIEYQDIFDLCVFDEPDERYSQSDIQTMMQNLVQGIPQDFDQTKVDPEKPFYVLGISPNAARLSVRFFYRNSFGNILKNVWSHHQRMEIIHSSKDKFEMIPVWRMVNATVNEKSRNKKASDIMTGELLRAILTGGRYPATLLQGIQLRIRAEHKITRERAAMIKAYYLRNGNQAVEHMEEVFTVALQKDSTNVPYNLGRLFSVLEAIQEAANKGLNTTIRDKYFNSASATPAVVFPTLVNLAQKHLRKIGGGLAVTYSKQMCEIMDKLGETYPNRLTLPEQGAFQLGYYHQTTVRFQGKNKED